MPGTTPNRGYPFPTATDLINVPADIERLARAVDTVDGTETVRRYPSVAARDAADPSPEVGQRCFCLVGASQGMEFIGRGGQWWALGLCVFSHKATTQSVAADSVWQLVTYTTSYWNIGTSFNGSTWTAPFLGYVHVTAGFMVGMGPAGVTLGDFSASIGVNHQSTITIGQTFNGRFAQVGLKASTVIGVAPGNTISVQGNVTGVGQTKTLYGTPSENTGLQIVYI